MSPEEEAFHKIMTLSRNHPDRPMRAGSEVIYWARVYLRELCGEEFHKRLDDYFYSRGYHRLEDK